MICGWNPISVELRNSDGKWGPRELRSKCSVQIGKWPCTSPVILTDADQSFAFDMTSRSHGWRDENTNSRLAANDPKRTYLKADGHCQSLPDNIHPFLDRIFNLLFMAVY